MYRFFEQLIDPMDAPKLDRPPNGTLAFFWHYLKPVWPTILLALLLVGVATAAELLMYRYLGQLLDWMTVGTPQRFFSEHGTAILIMVLVTAIVRPVALLGSRATINLALAPGIANRTRLLNHRYVLRQSMGFFQNDFAGRVAQKVLQTGNALRECVINVLDGAWMMVIYLTGIIWMFVDIHPGLLLPLLCWLVLYLIVVVLMVPPVKHKSAALSEAVSVVTGRIVDSYTNIQSVKLFAHHDMEDEFAAEGIRAHTHAFRRMMRLILNMTVALTLLNTALIVGMASLSVYFWYHSQISLGEIAVVNGLIFRLNHMSGWILRTITSLFENVGVVQNGMQTIAKPQAIVDATDAKTLHVSEGLIEFKAVSFDYRETSTALTTGQIDGPAPTVIESCNITINAGERVGLVGVSGAGKSTLINLLMRFHDPVSGRICIDNQTINEVTQDSLRQQIGVVTQDTALLHRSIRDNIRYGSSGASDEMIMQAADAAAASEFIPDLVDSKGRRGLDALVGERGVKLSGGQRQRIAIARVMLKNAPILILDEATSALDSDVEAVIQKNLNVLMQGKTVLAVAHRLSTIAALDRLIVLEKGQIVESGTHLQLIERNGVYSRLWKRQSGGFIGKEF